MVDLFKAIDDVKAALPGVSDATGVVAVVIGEGCSLYTLSQGRGSNERPMAYWWNKLSAEPSRNHSSWDSLYECCNSSVSEVPSL